MTSGNDWCGMMIGGSGIEIHIQNDQVRAPKVRIAINSREIIGMIGWSEWNDGLFGLD